ncbi:Ultraviolet-B receptor UVR8 [Apostasia shenzhenica]|uniref:Ultraviolet-B receptor UVR8 n=1 Tax=Apostasia shenzhenica TaxID=1088818 RepID=A0A2I0AZJ7_9ASPA|nr:Ultraviolet-B receptor UVR8 [Apostasia shenzhenica]
MLPLSKLKRPLMEPTDWGTTKRDGDEEEEEKVSLWSWGAGSEGQLANGTLEDHWLPHPVIGFLSVHPVSRLACGGAHVVALTYNGKVLTWGRGTCGQLGHGDLVNYMQPKIVKFPENIHVHGVSAGWNHSGFVSDTGHLFMCGDGSFGQLGNGDYLSHSSPQEVLFFLSKHVEQVACGMRHTIVLVRGSLGNSVYGFGSGRHGQIGIHLPERRKLFNIPEVIDGFGDSRIVDLCANGDHSAALSANGQLYLWGRGFNGSLDCHKPQILPSSLMFSQVALGWNHALMISDDQAYMLGRILTRFQQTSREQQALDYVVSVFYPVHRAEALSTPSVQAVTSPGDERVVGIAAGAEHSAIVTESGTIMTWGWGEHGQLGLGGTDDQICPQRVGIEYKASGSQGQVNVYCGSGFTFVAKFG